MNIIRFFDNFSTYRPINENKRSCHDRLNYHRQGVVKNEHSQSNDEQAEKFAFE